MKYIMQKTYKITGEVTHKFEIDISANFDNDAIDMAIKCVRAGIKSEVEDVKYTLDKINITGVE